MTAAYLKKFSFRFLIVNIVFFIVKYTTVGHIEKHDFFNPTHLFYYCSAFFLFMMVWESNDYLIRLYIKQYPEYSLTLNAGVRILLRNLAFVLPICAFVYYIGIFHFNEVYYLVGENETPILQFWQDFSRQHYFLLQLLFPIFFIMRYSKKKKWSIK